MRKMIWLLVPVFAAGCGGGSVGDAILGPSARAQEAQPSPPPTPAPTPTPEPEATPVPDPSPTPDDGRIPDDTTDNTNPVARVLAKLYHIECGGQLVEVPAVGCRLHLDATPVDAYGKHTQSRGGISWNVAGPVTADGGGAFTPAYRVLAAGEAVFVATVDGVVSNTVRVGIP